MILIGNVTWKDDVKQSEKPVCTFGLATNRNYTDSEGAKHEDTDFHRVVSFGKLAEFCTQYVRKGRLVYIEGRLHSHSWTDNTGQEKAVTEIVLTDISLLDSKKPEETEKKPAKTLNGEQLGTTPV